MLEWSERFWFEDPPCISTFLADSLMQGDCKSAPVIIHASPAFPCKDPQANALAPRTFSSWQILPVSTDRTGETCTNSCYPCKLQQLQPICQSCYCCRISLACCYIAGAGLFVPHLGREQCGTGQSTLRQCTDRTRSQVAFRFRLESRQFYFHLLFMQNMQTVAI